MGKQGLFDEVDFWEEELRGTYVRVTDDHLQAWLYLTEKPDHSSYTKEELVQLLKENGVTHGLNVSNLTAMAMKKVYHREIRVADAILPREGQDGYYEYSFDTTCNKHAPKIREDGSVDYQSMNIVENVKKGTLLARYHHAVPGRCGWDVTGAEISIKPVRELPALLGRGIERAADNPDVYQAMQDGKIEYQDGKLSIISIHEIKGDVDQLTGRVEFYGDVYIRGNVEANVIIKAGKTLTIEGSVESCYLYAGGDIILKRGIQGNQKAKIVAKGNIYADFIEHSTVQAGGNIEANVIMSSKIHAGGKITLTGKKGSLIGGSTYALCGIKCNYLGNDAEVRTIVSAGASKQLYEGLKKVEGSLIELKQTVKEESEEAAALREELVLEQRRLLAQLEKANAATIRVEDIIYRGCLLEIGLSRRVIEKNNRSMEYRNIAGMIAGSVLTL